ncbi:MAG: PQQ-like beta-propeller repeat protein [Planctomycetes bacterium]|nr:PQQ-like beta-propeller repeat protein [Planctomycetota bacterium]
MILSNKAAAQRWSTAGLLAGVLAVALCANLPIARAQWPQWGGPGRDFSIEATDLADSWPEDGPPQLWRRELGEGYSSIVVDDGRLYTMYRQGRREYTVALNARTGQTIWEHGNETQITDNMVTYGPGPHSTPLAVGEFLYSVGTDLDFCCFAKKSGQLVWKHDLLAEHGLTVPSYGYSCSPLRYENTVILPIVDQAGGEQVLAAFEQSSGRVVWRSVRLARDYTEHCEYSSPLIINLDGADQLVFLTNERVVGIDPHNGQLLWSHPHRNQQGVNISTPVWNGKDLLFCSGAYDAGSRLIRLRREDGQTTAEELWHTRKLRIHHGNALFIDNHIYGSSGDFGPALLVALNAETGKPAWRERGYQKASFIRVADKVILLDEDGRLALTTLTPEAFTVLSQCQLTERLSWTTPTLAGTTLYIRDRKHILALDLGRS